MTVDDAAWDANRKYILAELSNLRQAVERVNTNIVDLREKDLSQIRIDIAMLQVRSGLFGAVAGALVMAIPVLVKMFG